METKIKNLVKSAVLGVAVLGAAVALQSFNEIAKQNEDPYYPKVDGVYESTPLDMEQENVLWSCEENLHSDCAAQFSAPPSITNQSPTGNIKKGDFETL